MILTWTRSGPAPAFRPCWQDDSLGATVADLPVSSCANSIPVAFGDTVERPMLELHSSGFSSGQSIPTPHTCEGDDISPPPAWSGAPDGTKCFALLVDGLDAPDPAAPKRVFLHWLRCSIPASTGELPEGAGNRAPGAGARARRREVEAAMKGHEQGRAELMGTYERTAKSRRAGR